MIDLYFWPTPNGWKVSLMLEECGLPYTPHFVDIGRGDQFKPNFIGISPNNRIPALVDQDGPDGPISIFESGAILIYLAEKSGQFMPKDVNRRYDVLQWVFWQMGNLGPMAGQFGYFKNYSKDKIDHALERYRNEFNRLLGVMERQLADRDFLAGEYSVADMAAFPWARAQDRLGMPLDEFPKVANWLETIAARPAATRAYELGVGKLRRGDGPDEESRKKLFNQTAASVAALIEEFSTSDG